MFCVSEMRLGGKVSEASEKVTPSWICHIRKPQMELRMGGAFPGLPYHCLGSLTSVLEHVYETCGMVEGHVNRSLYQSRQPGPRAKVVSPELSLDLRQVVTAKRQMPILWVETDILVTRMGKGWQVSLLYCHVSTLESCPLSLTSIEKAPA